MYIGAQPPTTDRYISTKSARSCFPATPAHTTTSATPYTTMRMTRGSTQWCDLINNSYSSSLRVATGIDPIWELEDSYNLFECALYGDIEIVLRRLHAEAVKKMVSYK